MEQSVRTIRNGLLHFDGLATTTVFSGFLQPFFRDSWTRSGMMISDLFEDARHGVVVQAVQTECPLVRDR